MGKIISKQEYGVKIKDLLKAQKKKVVLFPAQPFLYLRRIRKCAVWFARPLGNIRDLATQQLAQPIHRVSSA